MGARDLLRRAAAVCPVPDFPGRITALRDAAEAVALVGECSMPVV